VTKENRTLFIVFFTILMDLIGFGVIIPISPFFAESLGANPALITLLGAIYSLTQFLFAPFWGRLSDRIGRRPVILTSIAIAAGGYVVFAYAESYWMLLAARMISGFGTANFGAAQAIIADSTPPERRARGMGILGAAFGLGFTLGPAFGGFLGQWGMRVPILTAAVLSGVNWCVAYLYLPETRVLGVSESAHSRSPLRQIIALGQDRNIRRLLWVFLIYSAAFSMMEQVLGLYIQHIWVGTVPAHPGESAGKASMLTAWALMVVGVTAIIVQGGLIGRLVARFGEKNLLIGGCFIVGAALILLPVTGMVSSFPLFLLACVLLAAGSGVSNPSASSLLSRASLASQQGQVMGVGQSLGALGRVAGPALAGWLFQVWAPFPFVLGGVMILCSGAMAVHFQPVDRVTN
jgi:MFS transporter, DHA1 family, tetracycline resistance protein